MAHHNRLIRQKPGSEQVCGYLAKHHGIRLHHCTAYTHIARNKADGVSKSNAASSNRPSENFRRPLLFFNLLNLINKNSLKKNVKIHLRKIKMITL